jgi:hypothetical protein
MNYIAVRLEKVWISDDMDTGFAGPEEPVPQTSAAAQRNLLPRSRGITVESRSYGISGDTTRAEERSAA